MRLGNHDCLDAQQWTSEYEERRSVVRDEQMLSDLSVIALILIMPVSKTN